jgi:hypothetical protein
MATSLSTLTIKQSQLVRKGYTVHSYQELNALPLNTKFTVFNGELLLKEDGEYTLSNVLGEGVIYLNNFERKVQIIPSPNNLLGKTYKVRRNDCVLLCSRYLDGVYNSTLEQTLLALTFREYLGGYTYGYQVSKLVDWGFVSIDNPQQHSIATYEDSNGATHICVFESLDFILCHHRGELSTRRSSTYLNNYNNVRYYNYGN